MGGRGGESISQLSVKDTSFLGQENSGSALELVRSTRAS